MKKFLLSLFFVALTVSSLGAPDNDGDADDQEMCDNTNIIQYLFERESNLLTVNTRVESKEKDGVVFFEHIIEIDFNESYKMSNLDMKTYFEEQDGNKYYVDWTADQTAGQPRIVVTIPNNEFTALNVESNQAGTVTTYNAPFVVSFIDECQGNPLKNYVFDFSVGENSSFEGSLALVSNTARDENVDCEGETGCVSAVQYEAELFLSDDTYSTPLDANTEFNPNQKINLVFDVKQTVSEQLTITSVKEALSTGMYTELIDNAFAFSYTQPSAGVANMEVRIMVSQAFTLIVEAQLTAENGEERRILAEVTNSHVSQSYYAGAHINVKSSSRVHVSTTTSDDETAGNSTSAPSNQDSTFEYLFYACAGILLLAGAFYAYISFAKKGKKTVDERRFFDEEERTYA